MPANRNVTSVETYSGQYVDLIHPDPATIRLEDIAVGLSNTARFAGQTTRFYSVAEHAVRVSQIVDVRHALYGLHHDSHEFVLGDIPAPLKAALRAFDGNAALVEMAARLDQAIGRALGIQWAGFYLPQIKQADDEAMYREASALKWSHGVGLHWLNDVAYAPWADIGWSPDRAVRKFLQRHEELTR